MDVFWLVVGSGGYILADGGWWWMAVGGGIVYSNPNLNASITKRVSNKKFKRIFHHIKRAFSSQKLSKRGPLKFLLIFDIVDRQFFDCLIVCFNGMHINIS